MIQLISYRLHRPEKDYPDLYDAIRKISGTYWHHTTSAWLVETTLSSKQVYETLNPYIDSDDDLVVFRLQGEWWGRVNNQSDMDWLKARTF